MFVPEEDFFFCFFVTFVCVVLTPYRMVDVILMINFNLICKMWVIKFFFLCLFCILVSWNVVTSSFIIGLLVKKTIFWNKGLTENDKIWFLICALGTYRTIYIYYNRTVMSGDFRMMKWIRHRSLERTKRPLSNNLPTSDTNLTKTLLTIWVFDDFQGFYVFL